MLAKVAAGVYMRHFLRPLARNRGAKKREIARPTKGKVFISDELSHPFLSHSNLVERTCLHLLYSDIM